MHAQAWSFWRRFLLFLFFLCLCVVGVVVVVVVFYNYSCKVLPLISGLYVIPFFFLFLPSPHLPLLSSLPRLFFHTHMHSFVFPLFFFILFKERNKKNLFQTRLNHFSFGVGLKSRPAERISLLGELLCCISTTLFPSLNSTFPTIILIYIYLYLHINKSVVVAICGGVFFSPPPLPSFFPFKVVVHIHLFFFFFVRRK
uniref:T. brucei spp.-specific protein n=1 Tax=Trypanosoma brucei TaxID=5691 RepID=Q583B0_9TRYP|nr:hypothetical protein Tb04.4J6.160 [Trypanosoma brucei]